MIAVETRWSVGLLGTAVEVVLLGRGLITIETGWSVVVSAQTLHACRSFPGYGVAGGWPVWLAWMSSPESVL